MYDKTRLTAYINTVTDFCIGDANTYLWAKCQPNFDKAHHVGGGNFAVLLTSFSLLDLLSYLNGLLNNEKVYTKEEIKDLKEKYKRTRHKVGDIKLTAKELVRKLIEETSSQTGIKLENVDRLWSIRHKLTHEFNPKLLPAASYGSMPGQDYDKLREKVKNEPIFTKGEKNQDCVHVHALNYKLQKMSDYLISKIEKTPQSTLEKTANWITNN